MRFFERKANMPEDIRSLLGSESHSGRQNISQMEAEWAYQTLSRLVRPTEDLPRVNLTVIGALALKIYCEWKTGEDKRHGKPIRRKTKDMDSAAV